MVFPDVPDRGPKWPAWSRSAASRRPKPARQTQSSSVAAFGGFRFALMPDTAEQTTLDYTARDRWPQWDLQKNPPGARHYLIVGKSSPVSNAAE